MVLGRIWVPCGFDLKSQSLVIENFSVGSTAVLTGRPIFARLLFLCFEVQKGAPSLSYCFAPISVALRPSRPAAKPALTCFVLISMVLRHWSSRLALRPASNFVSSYNFFWFAAISITLRP